MSKAHPMIEIRRLTRTIRRLKDSLDPASRLDRGKRGEFCAVYAALEELRTELLEKDTLLFSAEERTQQMIASVTHDLKTYVALISGYAECVQDGIDDKDYPELIRTKCAEMNEMILKIISNARNMSRDLKNRLQLVSLREYLPPVIKRAVAPACAKGILVKVNRIPNIRIALSSDEFGSVVENLLSNAAKHTPSGGKIKIRFYTSSKYFFMKVSDTGTGVAAEDADHIFERYYTADKSRALGSGTGIGLADAKDVMKAHGGDVVYVKSKKPGAVFLCYLPKYSKFKDSLTPDELKLVSNVFHIVAFPFVFVFRFFYIFYLAAKIAAGNRVVSASKGRTGAPTGDSDTEKTISD